MCFTCCAKVRTPLNSPLVGAKEYLSSGMASAAGKNSPSAWLTARSMICETVWDSAGFVCPSVKMGHAATSAQVRIHCIIFMSISFDLVCECGLPAVDHRRQFQLVRRAAHSNGKRLEYHGFRESESSEID